MPNAQDLVTLAADARDRLGGLLRERKALALARVLLRADGACTLRGPDARPIPRE